MKHKKLYLYTVDSNYVNYLASFTPHLYKEKEDKRSRKYIGIVLCVNGFSYFAPLTSFKKKHIRFSDSIDFYRIGEIAAINLNKMFPVPKGLYQFVNINSEEDPLKTFFSLLNLMMGHLSNTMLKPTCRKFLLILLLMI